MNATTAIQALQVLVVLLGVAALAWRIRALQRARHEARARSSDWLGGDAGFDVGYLGRTELERPETALRLAQPGLLVLGRESIRFAGVAPLSRKDVRLELEPGATRVALFPGAWYGVGLRSLVRLSDPSGSHYFFARRVLGQADEARTRALYEALRARVRPERNADAAAVATPLLGYLGVALSVGLVVAVLLALALLRADSGPWALAGHASAGVAAATEREVLRFGADGTLAAHRPFGELGLAHAPGSLAFDAAGVLHAGDPDDGRLYRCVDTGTGACVPLDELPDEVRPRGTFKFAFNADGRIALADTERDRLLLLDHDGRLLAKLERNATGLCFPNDLVFGADGRLYVADTNNFRVASFALENDRLRYVGEHMVVSARLGLPGAECEGSRVGRAVPRGFAEPLTGARDQRVWPLAIAQASDGHWWLALATGRLRRADVAEFDADWKLLGIHALGERNDPVQFAAWREEVWIADTEGPEIRRVRAGFERVPAADPALAAYFDGVVRQQARAELIRRLAPVAIVLPLALTVVVALVATRRRVARILRSEPATAGR